MIDRTGNLPPLTGISPRLWGAHRAGGASGPIADVGALGHWGIGGMPSPPSALQGKKTNTGVTNGLKGRSPNWRRWLNPESRCLVSFTSVSEHELRPDPSRQPIWLAFDEERPLAVFAGV
jgi:hypothetical protein